MRWYQKWTICGEMCRRGYITPKELQNDGTYVKINIPKQFTFMYKLLIIPIVLGMKMSTPFAEFVSEVTSRAWLNEVKVDIKVKPIYVQVKNPRTGRYVKIDKAHGIIIAKKRTYGPYVGVFIAHHSRQEIPNEY